MEHIMTLPETTMFSWLKSLVSPGGGRKREPLTPQEEALLNMDIEQVLGSHDSWKRQIEETIKLAVIKPLNLSEVASDRKCTLGRWLEGPVKKLYSHLPEYKSAKQAHAHFHFCAAEVLIYHNDGDQEKALELLNTKFRNAVNVNKVELVRLFVAIRNLQ